jgi:4-alpha-glucanotransferase
MLIAAPACPEAPRAWGAFIPLHALRSETDWGTGSYSELASLGQFVSALGGSMMGSLPLYPAFLDGPADPSPYRPVSRLAYNELYVDPTALPERSSVEARQLLEDSEFVSRLGRAHESPLVDYEEISKLKRRVLEPMSEYLFSGASTQRRDELGAFAASHPELVDYASFRAGLDTAGRRGARGGLPEPGRREDAAFNYHLYCQFAAYCQLSAAESAIRLYADLPIGVHPDGFDPSWSPASFVTTVRGGAPPDAFFTSGQDWGFPPLHPERIRLDGYGYLRAVLSRAFRHAGFLRIDHVMGLQRLYAIPEGFDARHGAYISYRAEEMHALVSLEAYRAGTVVVGEDLGTVPDEVRERMAADKMLRSWVFQFESSARAPLPAPPRNVLASLGTHDLPRFDAYLWGTDIDEKQEKGQLSTKAATAQRRGRDAWRRAFLGALGATDLPPGAQERVALEGALAHLARSSAALVLVDLEELWGEREPQNRPGTGPEADNWRRRARWDMAQIRNDPGLHEMLSRIDGLRRAEPLGERGGGK